MGFVAREKELRTLSEVADSGGFHMVVVYGRRRVGKTALLAQFCKHRRAIMFTAREQSAAENLRSFSREVYRFFDVPESTGSLAGWMDAFDYLAAQAKAHANEPLVLVFDEFPYAAGADKSLPSQLQIAIDHTLRDTNVTLVLCGSNEGFMASEVLGAKSPLYGRRSAQIRLKPFDLFDACKMLPANAAWEDLYGYYAALGGTPYYLEQVVPELSFAQNIERLCFTTSGLLYEEPAMLMRQELREPALYNSLLSALAAGRTTQKVIAEYAGLEPGTVSPYLKTLEGLGLIERVVPFGENPARSRKGIWKFKDPFFAYWYRFVSPVVGLVERGIGHAPAVASTSGEAFSTYVGHQFEAMCAQWVVRQCQEGKLNILPTSMGAWWGTDPVAREQADIDLVVGDSINGKLLLGECKWRNEVNETEAIATLRSRSRLVGGDEKRLFALFTKHSVHAATRKKAQADPGLLLVDAQSMLGA